MIAFCCSSLYFLACCCLFYEFIASSSFCHLHFIVAFWNLLSFVSACCLLFCLHELFSSSFIHLLVLLCLSTFVYDCISLHFSVRVWCFLFYEFTVLSFLGHLLVQVYDCGLLWFVYFVIFWVYGCLSFPPWFISFHQSKELHLITFVVVWFFLLGILLSFLFLHCLFHLPNQMNDISLQYFSLFCFVLGNLLSSLFIHSYFLLSIPVDGQQVVVVVLLFSLLSCHLSLFVVSL